MKQENPIDYSPYIPFFKDVADYNVAFGHFDPYSLRTGKQKPFLGKRAAIYTLGSIRQCLHTSQDPMH